MQGPVGRPIFLVGFMGCGKSHTAAALASRLDRVALDTDALVEQREARTIETIFRESGEGHFRRAEWEALQTLRGRGDAVVATGGGLYLGVAQRAWLRRHGQTVWLDTPLHVCRNRVGAGVDRPLWSNDDPVALRALYERRRAVYALAELRVAAGAGRPDEVAARIAERLEGKII